VKKNETSSSYELEDEIFYIADKEDSVDFMTLLNFILSETFKKLNQFYLQQARKQ
jgi:hypothetical protein